MGKSSRDIESRGVTTVEDIVTYSMGCGWQEFDHQNDKGIDGLIIDRKNGIDTGDVYHVQVKCGESYLLGTNKRASKLEIDVGQEYIENHRPRWLSLQSPAIIIYVDPKTRKAWWSDLKSSESYCPDENKGIILIPERQRFAEHSIGHIRKLRSHVTIDRHLDLIKIGKEDVIDPSFSMTLKEKAREYYKEWSRSPISERLNPVLGDVRVSRVGWRHISRSGRGGSNIANSWRLLGAAKNIILNNNNPHRLHRPDIEMDDGVKTIHDHVSLRSRVKMPAREEKVVQVILKRKKEVDISSGNESSTIWFYSVHEPRRNKKRH